MNFDGVITALERIEIMIPKAQSVAIRNGIDAIKNRRDAALLIKHASLSGPNEMSELSRPSKTGPFGSNDRRLDMLVSESLEEAIITMASLNGVTKSEFARGLLEKALFGEFSMARMMHSESREANRRNVG